MRIGRQNPSISRFFDWLDSIAELRGHDPWRDSSFGDVRASKPGGLTLFDLAEMYLEENGYYVRFYRNRNLMVVYNSWWRHKLHNRSKCVAFELCDNRPRGPVWINKNPWAPKTRSNPRDTVVSFNFGTDMRALHYNGDGSYETVGKVSDPFCLESILKIARNHFDKL